MKISGELRKIFHTSYHEIVFSKKNYGDIEKWVMDSRKSTVKYTHEAA